MNHGIELCQFIKVILELTQPLTKISSLYGSEASKDHPINPKITSIVNCCTSAVGNSSLMANSLNESKFTSLRLLNTSLGDKVIHIIRNKISANEIFLIHRIVIVKDVLGPKVASKKLFCTPNTWFRKV